MDLSHRDALAVEPRAVVLAEGRIAIAVRLLLQIFQVQELQRDAGPPQFGVDPGRIRERARRMAGNLRAIEPLFERVVAHPLECVPRQPDAAGAADDRRDRAGTDPQAPRRLAVASLQLPFQSQNLSNVSHGQSFCRHRPLRRPALGQNGDGKTTPCVAPAAPQQAPMITMRGIGDHDPWNG